MVGGNGRRRIVRAVSGVVMVLAVGVGCGGGDADPGPPVPTFPGPATEPDAATGPVDVGLLPDDCARLLPASDLGALLAMPLDSVAVRTTNGVPAPAVGRTERLDCDYAGTAGQPVTGRTLLDLTVAAYTDAVAARKQWRTNIDIEDGERRELPIGAASAVLIERPQEVLLTVVYGSGTLTVVLPDGPRPPDRPRDDVLIDLTLRLLPGLAATAPTEVATVAPPDPALAVDPARAGDTAP